MSRNCVWLRVHLVWTTKFREATIDPVWESDLHAYIAGVAKNKGCHLIAAGGMADHIHLYVSLSNDISVGSLVNAIKTNSSRWINQVHPLAQRFRWQRGYGAFTMNQKNERYLRSDIANQKRHHLARTAETEMLQLAKLHGHTHDSDWLN